MSAAILFALKHWRWLAGAAVLALAGVVLDGEDDEPEDVLSEIAAYSAKTLLAGLPVVRDAVGLLDGFQGGTYASILKAFVKPIEQAGQGELDLAAVKSVIDLTGMVARIPSTAINRVVDAGTRDAQGKDVSPLEYLMGKPRQ